MNLSQGKVALVTGASSGIGKATAIALAEAGFTTYATARRPETLADLTRLGCRPLQLDVTDETSMKAAIQHIEAVSGPVSILVNNAGYGEYGPLEELELDAVRQEFETNVFGLLQMCQLVLPGMRRGGWGRIVNVSSVGGEMALPGGGAYHASKYAVEALSDVLRYEVKPFGVEVVVIQPGNVKTGFAARTASSTGLQSNTGPYAGLKLSLANTMKPENVERIPGNTADEVAKVILRAIQSPRPHTRYKISLLAHVLPALRNTLPDRGWDAMMKRLFPNPS